MRFEIPLPDGRTVFMHDDMSKLRIIVWVSTKKFLQLWDTYQQNDTVVTNIKYPYAETCFAQSERYPVPVADAGDIRTDNGKVRLDGGITRTTWLIRNGAQSFPLACLSSGAAEIERLLGVK